jgi:aminomethyltransferase
LENQVTDAREPAPRKVPLDALHRARGARMVPFAGYDMPLQYEGIIAEHLHTRAKASLFDVSHMGQAILRGPKRAEALEALVPGDIKGLAARRLRYTVLTNETGGILDDLIVSNGGDHLFLVVNASRKEADFAHIRDRLPYGCTLDVLGDRALLAVQGPSAGKVLSALDPALRHVLFMNFESLAIAGIPCLATRSGYTGEDGFEISLPAAEAERMVELLLEDPDVRLAGLGARDSLRLEAGLCLYGADIDETTTPIEAGLAWCIGKRRRAEGGFPGAAVILKQLGEGVSRKRVGIRPEGRQPVRAHAEIVDPTGRPIGHVTSGGYGPTVGGPVAMGYVETACAAPGTAVDLMVRGKALPGRVVDLPFVAHRYYKG